jgi:hypothetical protein
LRSKLAEKLFCRTGKKTSGTAEYSPAQNSILKPPLFCVFTPPVTAVVKISPVPKQIITDFREAFLINARKGSPYAIPGVTYCFKI